MIFTCKLVFICQNLTLDSDGHEYQITHHHHAAPTTQTQPSRSYYTPFELGSDSESDPNDSESSINDSELEGVGTGR